MLKLHSLLQQLSPCTTGWAGGLWLVIECNDYGELMLHTHQMLFLCPKSTFEEHSLHICLYNTAHWGTCKKKWCNKEDCSFIMCTADTSIVAHTWCYTQVLSCDESMCDLAATHMTKPLLQTDFWMNTRTELYLSVYSTSSSSQLLKAILSLLQLKLHVCQYRD